MRIVNLEVQDFMGVSAVEITPTDDVVTIGGKNGAGKSSVLNAIVSALGGAKTIPGVPVREGEKQSVTRLTLSRPEGDLEVIRAIKTDGKTTLTVKSADGAKYSKPQQLLDGLVGAIGFDPHSFTRLDQRKQAEQLRELVGVDLSAIDADRQRLYAERTEVNRDVRHLSARLESLPHHDDAPDADVSVADLFEELDEAVEFQRLARDAEDEAANSEANIRRSEDRISSLQQELNDEKTALKQLLLLHERQVKESALAKEAAESVDPDGIRERLQQAESDNRKVRENADRHAAAKRLAAIQDDADELTKAINGLDEEKRMALAAAKWPVDGLGFDMESGDVTFNGRPFSQASSAEQLRVSLAMGMALNPKLRVLIIRDGSLIDDDTMAVIRDAVRDNEFQLWIERVSTSGDGCTLVIDEGRVAELAA